VPPIQVLKSSPGDTRIAGAALASPWNSSQCFVVVASAIHVVAFSHTQPFRDKVLHGKRILNIFSDRQKKCVFMGEIKDYKI